MNPSENIVPIVATDDELHFKHFLGTGCFIKDIPILATADHVIRDWAGQLAIAAFPKLDALFPAFLVERNSEADLALLEVPDYPKETGLRLAQDSEITQNQQVLCFEYGTTRRREKMTILAPATRLGNVTRILNLEEQYGLAGRDALELSFPALKGSSGAPVVSNSTFNIWGIVIANVNYHLLPAQIESVWDEEKRIEEETRFLLPQGIAVHVKHLREMLGQ